MSRQVDSLSAALCARFAAPLTVRRRQSLATCSEWEPRGGKTDSEWHRTADGRFVLKFIKRRERDELLKLAPAYLRHMCASSLRACGEVSLLSKILGVFTVDVSMPLRSTTNSDIIVMENLFFERELEFVYDLKGSVRSRYVDPDAEGAVLQDENLLETMFATPFCVTGAAKARMAAALYNDSRFLASHLLLDYSLLVGVDKQNNVICCGIIDYLSGWSAARRAEHIVKRTGLLGQRGKTPTVVPPLEYAARFRDALWGYFMLVPNKFTTVYISRVAEQEEQIKLLDE